MIANLVASFMAVCALSTPPVLETSIAVFSPSAYSATNPETPLPPNVSVTVDPDVQYAGAAALRIIYAGAGPTEVNLFFQSPLPRLENSVLTFAASLRSAETTSRAYLNMWVTSPEGQSYFSRGLDQVLSGRQDWRLCETPFYLKAGENPVSATLGVRFEGPGVLWVAEPRLFQRAGLPGSMSMATSKTPTLLCALFGCLIGLWGALAGTLAPRGKAKGLLCALGAVLLLFGVILVAAGLAKLSSAAPRETWYPLLLTGGIATLVLVPLLRLLPRRYREYEEQRMRARDQAADL